MGSPVSPIVVDLYMESLEQKIIAMCTAPEAHKPRHWERYIDDIICVVYVWIAEQNHYRNT